METLIRMAIAFICRRRYLRSPALVAFLLHASFRPVPGRGKEGQARHVVLILPRPGLTEDALAVLENAAEFSVLSAPRGILKALAVGFLPATIDDNNYANLSAAEETGKREYRNFLQQVLGRLLRICSIDLIMSGNFAYFAERELHDAAESLGVPFVILHKENLKSPGRRSYYEDHYRRRRGPFRGRRVLVYNSFERAIQIAAGIVPPDRIDICGMPRLDRAHAWRCGAAGKALPQRPRVLFFTFGVKTGLPALRRKGAGGDYLESLPEFDNLNWEQTARQTMHAVVRFAKENPKVEVIVKSKHASGHADIFRVCADGEMPSNIRLVEGGDPLVLLQDAWVVLGMNSTALLEALAMGKPVLSPGFAEAGDPAMLPWIADFGPSVEKMQSPDQLIARLSELTQGPVPVVAAQLHRPVSEALEEWAGNPDGRASERVVSVIESEIAASFGSARRSAA
jgi:hypothetical protein